MRRLLAAVLVTASTLLVPATAAHADPPPHPAHPHRPVEVTSMWPVCVTVLGSTICIPP
jgi:hypothetical protein